MKKGFTLIELLAVIVILAIIALIATPLTLGLIENAKKGSFKASLNSIFRAAELYETENNFQKIDASGIAISELNITNNHFSGKVIRDSENNNELVLVNVSDGTYCANGKKNDLVITNRSCSTNNEVNYENEASPSIPILSSDRSTSNKIVSQFSNATADSGIKEYNCYYGTDGNDLSSIGSVSETTCIFDNLTPETTYYYKICATSNADKTTCSEISSKRTTTLAYYAFGEPTSSSTTDYTMLGRNVFVKLEKGQKYLCIIKSGSMHCFTHIISRSAVDSMKSSFSDGNCIYEGGGGANICSTSSFECRMLDETYVGGVKCDEKANGNHGCHITYNGVVTCK